MKLGRSLLVAAMMIVSVAPARAAPAIVAASGHWAALRGPKACEAATLALLPAGRTRAQGRAAFAFEPGRRRGEFAAALSRPGRPGAAVILTIGDTPFLLVARGAGAWSRGPAQEAAIIAAVRGAASMRIEAHSAGGARFIDRYALDGAPTAIDAAAACAATMLVNH
ncbi:MAG: hypothetical protein LC656_04520 [Sphingomonadales bacterium]|nr:hypothetical protein [Sphingomonadales bacterium]